MNAQIKQIEALQGLPSPTPDVAQGRSTAAILSHDQGAYPASIATQKLLCFLGNGELLIAHHKRLDPLVQEYVQGLKTQRVPYTIANVDLSELKAHYGRAASSGTSTTSDAQNSHRQRRIVDIIKAAQQVNASDIHAYVGRDIGEIRFRVNGLLESIPGYQHEPEEVQLLISTIYNSMLEAGGNASYFQPLTPQDGRIRQEFLDPAVLSGVRCATRPKDRGMIGIFRLLYAHRGVKQLPSLGYLPEQIEVWNRLLRRKVGMNILSGPTGSGKSTTLSTIFAMQVEYFHNKLHVLTVEDPVEYEIPGVNHTNVNRDDNNPDWAGSIKNMMRLDPDIAGVGEMRDHASAVAAFALATTGHGTYSTLHANDAFAIVQRLLDLKVDPGLIYDPAVLTGLVNQGLAPTLCPHCKVPWQHRPSTYDAQLAARVENTLKDTSGVYVVGGCDRCRHTGASGRTVVAEVVETNMELMRVMRTQGAAEARALWVHKQGGITKTAHMLRRIAEGVIDPAHAEAAIGPVDEDLRMIEVQ
jgi:general secretion pathway protein E